ncbi:hypothetical protein ACEQ8H_003941 [Pleosporales sp. CAS-2024a]
MQDDVDVDDDDMSALDYARHYGLCTPYDGDPIDYDSSLPALSMDTLDQDLWDPLHTSAMNAVQALTKERLLVSRDAALLLRAVHDLQHKPSTDELSIPRLSRIQDLRQELPILHTDDELDSLQFGTTTVPNLAELNIPDEVIDPGRDEGFSWPTKYQSLPEQCDNQFKAEKLAVSREALLYLHDAITNPYSLEEYERSQAQCLQYTPNVSYKSITPPLLPLSPPLTPYIPSSPTNHLPLAPESDDSVAIEARDWEHRIMKADSLLRNNSDDSDVMLLDTINRGPPSSISDGHVFTSLKRKEESLKVEGPLTPPILSDSPMKKLKSVTFSDALHQFIPNAPWAKTFMEDKDHLSEGSDIDFDELFKDIASYCQEARDKVESERLIGADTIARVDIPAVDFTNAVAPWDEYSRRLNAKHGPSETELNHQARFLLRIKREDLKAATSWHGVSSLERRLPWGILTVKAAKINLEEQLHGENDLTRIQAEFKGDGIATSSSQIWKLEGLTILRESEDEDDDLDLGEFEERRDMDALVRKRKLELEEDAPAFLDKRAFSTSKPPKMPGNHGRDDERSTVYKSMTTRSRAPVHQDTMSQLARPRIRPVMQIANAASNDVMFGGFSATSALHKFMETRGKPVTLQNMVTEDISQSVHGPDHNPFVRPREALQTQLAASSPSLPQLPDIPRDLAPCSFIVSCIFLKKRSLMKQIEQLYGEAEMIYRDYLQPCSPAEEADVLLSPSTGLIMSTLQQIKQQPLPGQMDRSPVKERMTQLQLRYERLLVVISEGLSREMEDQGSSRPDDVRDKDALARLEAFAAQLEGEVMIKYVPGGERALARSIVVEMAEYGLPHGSQDIGDIKLMAVETTWEMFLRRAGVNPFAAQIIVASLKNAIQVRVPDTLGPSAFHNQSQPLTASGLSAFLLMSEEDRIRFFQALMGGGRILRRVSRILDQAWVSASHGFRL